jgi:hypothetical protein
MMLTGVLRFADAWHWAVGRRDVHGLRPRPRLGLAGLRDALVRAGRGARAVIRRGSRPLPLEALIWILMAVLVLLYGVALFTRERAIAP